MTQFELVIFDCDGVLVDSEGITIRVLAAMLNEMGLDVSTEKLHDSFHGRSMAQWLVIIADMSAKPLPDTFVPALRERAAAALWAEITPISGVADVLAHLSIPFCVASSGDHEKMRLTLGKTGLSPWFGTNIFSTFDVENPKPAPDIYLHAARQMGVDPRACAVIEDSPTGVQAGVAACMTVFGFAAQTPEQQLSKAGAHAIFTDMTQLPELLASPYTDYRNGRCHHKHAHASGHTDPTRSDTHRVGNRCYFRDHCRCFGRPESGPLCFLG